MMLTAGSLTQASESGPIPACYRTPGDSRPRGRKQGASRTKRGPPVLHPFSRRIPTSTAVARREARSTDADARRRNEHPHLAPEQLKQDRDSTIVGDAF